MTAPSKTVTHQCNRCLEYVQCVVSVSVAVCRLELKSRAAHHCANPMRPSASPRRGG